MLAVTRGNDSQALTAQAVTARLTTPIEQQPGAVRGARAGVLWVRTATRPPTYDSGIEVRPNAATTAQSM